MGSDYVICGIYGSVEGDIVGIQNVFVIVGISKGKRGIKSRNEKKEWCVLLQVNVGI